MADLVPLSRWHQIAPENLIAVDRGAELNRSMLASGVSRWLAALRRFDGNRWAVYHGDTFEFLCILLALWQLGRTACIAGDNRPGTAARLADYMDGLAGEFESRDALRADSGDDEPGEVEWQVVEAEFPALEIYTSGSTGEPKSIVKTMQQIEREIDTLESCWPGDRRTVLLSTVSHQHLYGMTFALFWPFSRGCAFERYSCELIEDIYFKAGFYDRFALVSSPSHLGRLGNTIDWDSLAPGCDYVLSSAAPLAREDSLAVGRLFDVPVREIYGSSETGAVAWRIQRRDEPDALWRPLPGVGLQANAAGGLRVNSSYQEAPGHMDLPDRVEFVGTGGFRLLGRQDSIVKVEGKRVSLAAIEQCLVSHSWVKQARALILERVRVETAVVMQLSKAGQASLQGRGRRAMIDEFRRLLQQDFEAVVIPRRWRFVETLPYNRQGKLPLDSLRGLFERDAVIWPQILGRQLDDAGISLHCRIPAQLLYFDGHMPGRPILPGIVQVHWAESYGREWLPVRGRFERLEVLKFQQVILPENQITISLAWDDEKGKLSFRYESDKGVHSSGRICFRR